MTLIIFVITGKYSRNPSSLYTQKGSLNIKKEIIKDRLLRANNLNTYKNSQQESVEAAASSSFIGSVSRPLTSPLSPNNPNNPNLVGEIGGKVVIHQQKPSLDESILHRDHPNHPDNYPDSPTKGRDKVFARYHVSTPISPSPTGIKREEVTLTSPHTPVKHHEVNRTHDGPNHRHHHQNMNSSVGSPGKRSHAGSKGYITSTIISPTSSSLSSLSPRKTAGNHTGTTNGIRKGGNSMGLNPNTSSTCFDHGGRILYGIEREIFLKNENLRDKVWEKNILNWVCIYTYYF